MAKQEKLNMPRLIKGVWFWRKEWWWVLAMNEVIRRKLKDNPTGKVTIRVSDINAMIDELFDSLPKRLRILATTPPYVSLISVPQITLLPD